MFAFSMHALVLNFLIVSVAMVGNAPLIIGLGRNVCSPRCTGPTSNVMKFEEACFHCHRYFRTRMG
ncbi:hypothetical protein ACB092_06G055400 [Castanea dentata]